MSPPNLSQSCCAACLAAWHNTVYFYGHVLVVVPDEDFGDRSFMYASMFQFRSHSNLAFINIKTQFVAFGQNQVTQDGGERVEIVRGEGRWRKSGSQPWARHADPKTEHKLPLLASRARYLHPLSAVWVIRGYHNQAFQR